MKACICGIEGDHLLIKHGIPVYVCRKHIKEAYDFIEVLPDIEYEIYHPIGFGWAFFKIMMILEDNIMEIDWDEED